MSRKIFQSIMAVAGAVMLASLVIIMACLYDYFAGVEKKALMSELNTAVGLVEADGTDYLKKMKSDRYRVTWIQPDGTVIYDTETGDAQLENHADRDEVKQALQSGTGESTRYSATTLQKTIYRAEKLPDGTVLRISASYATVGLLALGMLQPVLLVVIAALIFGGILASRVAHRIVAPINDLNLDRPLENDTYEEIVPLLHRINQQRMENDAQLARLRQRSDEFAQITGSMNEGLVLLDEQGTVLSLNPAAEKLFGATETAVGQTFLIVDRTPELSAAIQRARETGHAEIRQERSGRAIQIDVSRIESNGAAVGAVLLAFDVTEQENAERMRREFTANVSHELKTPIQGIIGSAELIESGMVQPADLPRFVGHIRKEAARLMSLIQDIIRLSQLDEGVPMEQEPVDLAAVSAEAAAALAEAAAKRSVTLTVSGRAQTVGVRRLLYEVVYNLCDNAIKYNVPGGRVTVTLDQTDRGAEITVADTGIGIAPEHQSRVFERFYCVDKSHSKESGGTGLGLSIVKHAVQYHHGKIDLQSEPGKGTTIRVALPAAQ